MLMECPESLRPRLLSLYSDLSRQTGYLAYDLNDFDGAWYYYEQARNAAHEAQNNVLAAHPLPDEPLGDLGTKAAHRH